MTERLYYDDSYSQEFEATVMRAETRGDQQAVWLNRSSFYPTSGGQSCDTGSLGASAVVDVLDEDGDVVHIVRAGAFQVGDTVHGAIDWARRFDHMQQHTGQHLLSAAFVRTAGVPTVSVHLGRDTSTIDIARDVRVEDVASAEDDANRIVWQDRIVTVRYVEAVDAAELGLRKASKRTGTLRLIDIADYDLSACGGSHVGRTGGVGVIAVTGWERFKGGMRIEFVCGQRALQRYRALRDVIAEGTRFLSVQPAELPAAIERLQSDARSQKRALTEAERELGVHRAQSLAASAHAIGGSKLVVAAVDGDVQALKSIATAIASAPGYGVVLISTASPGSIVATRSACVPLPCDAIVRSVCAAFGGRGGGKPDLARGGALVGSADAILAEARALAMSALG